MILVLGLPVAALSRDSENTKEALLATINAGDKCDDAAVSEKLEGEAVDADVIYAMVTRECGEPLKASYSAFSADDKRHGFRKSIDAHGFPL